MKRRVYRNFKKLFISHISNKRLESRIYKELSMVKNNQTKNPTNDSIRKWAKTWRDTSPERKHRSQVNRKRYSTPLAIILMGNVNYNTNELSLHDQNG